MTDWNMLQRFADIGASTFARHHLYEDIRQEILFDLWLKVRKEPDIDRPLLVWYAKTQAYRHFNAIEGDPRSKRGRRALRKNTSSYDAKVDLQERIEQLGKHDTYAVPVSEQLGLEGREAKVADMLSHGMLKTDIADRMGLTRTQITRVCKKLAVILGGQP